MKININTQNLKGLQGKYNLRERDTEEIFTVKDEYVRSPFEEKPDYMKTDQEFFARAIAKAKEREKESSGHSSFNIAAALSVSVMAGSVALGFMLDDIFLIPLGLGVSAFLAGMAATRNAELEQAGKK